MKTAIFVAVAAAAAFFLLGKKSGAKSAKGAEPPPATGVEDEPDVVLTPIDIDECIEEIGRAISDLSDSKAQGAKDKLHLMADVKSKQVELLRSWQKRFEKKGYKKAAICAQRLSDYIEAQVTDKVG